MGGGGEDFGAQTAAAEAKKQTARDALNLQFGVAGSSPAPSRDAFTTHHAAVYGPGGGPPATGNPGDYQAQDNLLSPEGDTFDQTGYDAALAAFNNRGADADKNKAAREALYSTVRNDAFTAGTRKLDEGKTTAGRDLKFALFGQGLNGGSEDINQNALLDRTYNQGRLELGAKADAAEADLRGNDEQTRLGLLQSIDSGLDQGSALSSSLNSLRVNSDRAAASAQGTDLGDLFGNAGLLYSKSKAGQGVQDARAYFNTQYPGTALGRGSSGSRNGIQSSTGG